MVSRAVLLCVYRKDIFRRTVQGSSHATSFFRLALVPSHAGCLILWLWMLDRSKKINRQCQLASAVTSFIPSSPIRETWSMAIMWHTSGPGKVRASKVPYSPPAFHCKMGERLSLSCNVVRALMIQSVYPCMPEREGNLSLYPPGGYEKHTPVLKQRAAT